jgi:hypothetical protein
MSQTVEGYKAMLKIKDFSQSPGEIPYRSFLEGSIEITIEPLIDGVCVAIYDANTQGLLEPKKSVHFPEDVNPTTMRQFMENVLAAADDYYLRYTGVLSAMCDADQRHELASRATLEEINHFAGFY